MLCRVAYSGRFRDFWCVLLGVFEIEILMILWNIGCVRRKRWIYKGLSDLCDWWEIGDLWMLKCWKRWLYYGWENFGCRLVRFVMWIFIHGEITRNGLDWAFYRTLCRTHFGGFWVILCRMGRWKYSERVSGTDRAFWVQQINRNNVKYPPILLGIVWYYETLVYQGFGKSNFGICPFYQTYSNACLGILNG